MNLNELINYLKNLFSTNPEFLNEVFNKDVVLSIAPAFNLDGEALYSVVQVVPKIARGEIQFKEILPALIPVLITYFFQKKLPPQICEGRIDENCSNNLSNFDEKPAYSTENECFSKNLDEDFGDNNVDFIDLFLQEY